MPSRSRSSIKFEDFVADPLATIARVYATLGLDGFAEHEDVFRAWIDAHHEDDAVPYEFTDDEIAAVEARLGHWIARWGYARAPVRARSTA
jgi:hypothetical protein